MSQRRSGKKFLIGIAVTVLVPLFCYLAVSRLSKGKISMPRYYVAEKAENGDTTYHQVSDLVLTNQLGQQVSLANDLKDKVVVIDFFFSTCSGPCPRLTGNMKLLQNSFKKDPKKEGTLDSVVHLVSITVVPEQDSFPVLRTYADRYGVNHDHWWFLTGDKKTIYNFARNELHVNTGPGDGGADDLVHAEQLVLLDKDRYVRGYYNGLDDKEVRKCADDIVLLTMERKHKK